MSGKPATQSVRDIIAEIVNTWRQGDNGNLGFSLDDLQNDPVVEMLVRALVSLSNNLGDDIARFQDQAIEQCLALTAPYWISNPIPSIGLVNVAKSVKGGALNSEPTILDASYTFLMSDTVKGNDKFTFVPLLRTRIADAAVTEVNHLAHGSFELVINANEDLSDPSLLSLLIIVGVTRFSALRLSTPNGEELPVVEPTHYDALPFDPHFQQIDDGHSATALGNLTNLADLFSVNLTQIGATFLTVADHCPVRLSPVDGLYRLRLDFIDPDNDPNLSPDNIYFNCLPLVNVDIHTHTLTNERPLHRIDLGRSHLLGLAGLHPDLDGKATVALRRLGTERSSDTTLRQLLRRLVNLYNYDHGLFRQFADSAKLEEAFAAIRPALDELAPATTDDRSVYLVLSGTARSADADYLTTDGTRANNIYPDTARIHSSNAELRDEQIKLITPTLGGRDQLADPERHHQEIVRYNLSHDRIVSRSDLRDFCRHFLLTCPRAHLEGNRYVEDGTLSANQIASIEVKPYVASTATGHLQRIMLVVICLHMPVDGMEAYGLALERLIAARSAILTPVRVAFRQA